MTSPPTPQSAEIQRWRSDPSDMGPLHDPKRNDGPWVKHSDHLAAIAKLSEERDALRTIMASTDLSFNQRKSIECLELRDELYRMEVYTKMVIAERDAQSKVAQGRTSDAVNFERLWNEAKIERDAALAEVERVRKALEEVRTRCADEVAKRDSGDWADTNVVSMGDIARKALRGAVDDLPPTLAAKGEK